MSQEPYNRSIEEIGQLTPYQVKNILFRQLDEHRESGGRTGLTDEELFYNIYYRDKGYPLDEVRKLYREHVERQKKLHEMREAERKSRPRNRRAEDDDG